MSRIFGSLSPLSLQAATVTLVVLNACTAPQPIIDPAPSPSHVNATPLPGSTPTPFAAGSATPTPSATPDSPGLATPEPSGSPTPPPQPKPSATASSQPSATASPSGSPSADTSTGDTTTFNGKVFDDTNAPLSDVTITAKSLNSGTPFTATATTSGGSYSINNAPAGVTIEITASKTGYTSRRRAEVLKSNKTGDPNANRYDFGTDGSSSSFGVAYNGLSDKPEVTSAKPDRNASGIDAATDIVLTFSEPMDRATVQDNFEIRAFNSKKLTVDTRAAASTLTGPANLSQLTGTRIWDKSAFYINWNIDDTEATFTFKESRSLPSDKDSSKTPDYQVDFNRGDGSLKDKQGVSRTSTAKLFKLSDGDFETSYKFSVKPDTTKPTVDSIVAQTAENSGSNGDAIKVSFDKPMAIFTLGPTIGGGMGGTANQAPGAMNTVTGAQAAANYKVTITRSGTPILTSVGWDTIGGTATFDTNDPTRRTVILIPPGTDIYKPGDTVKVVVDTTVLDPAGNSIDSGNNEASASAG